MSSSAVCDKEKSQPDDVFGWKCNLLWPRSPLLKLPIGFIQLFSSYTEHSAMPREPFGQILSVMCQRAGGESLLVRQGPCLADLKSQMRSHLGKNGELSLSTRKATFLCMEWKPRKRWISVRRRGWRKRKKKRKDATPPSCRAPAHHTSHESHTPFHVECSGPTS